jgi:Laminin G domain
MKILQRSIALGALVVVVAVGAPAIGATSAHGKAKLNRANADPLNPDTFAYPGEVTTAGAVDSSGQGNNGLVSTASGGTVTEGTDVTYGSVLRFPQTTCSTAPSGSSCPRATVSPQDQSALNPLDGSGSFVFGATVRMSTVAGKAGMNILQRGVFGDGQAQWKLQTDYKGVDGFRVASCRFADGTTAVMVTGTKKLAAGTWYDLACRRSGSTFSLVVDQVNGTAADETVSATASLAAIAPTKPATIGGKAITATPGQNDTATDQFHGDLDGVFFRRVAG